MQRKYSSNLLRGAQRWWGSNGIQATSQTDTFPLGDLAFIRALIIFCTSALLWYKRVRSVAPCNGGQIGGNWSPIDWINLGAPLRPVSLSHTHTFIVEFRTHLATFHESIGVASKTNGACWGGVRGAEGEWGREPRLGLPSFVSPSWLVTASSSKAEEI